jgi:hypothetical protein
LPEPVYSWSLPSSFCSIAVGPYLTRGVQISVRYNAKFVVNLIVNRWRRSSRGRDYRLPRSHCYDESIERSSPGSQEHCGFL